MFSISNVIPDTTIDYLTGVGVGYVQRGPLSCDLSHVILPTYLSDRQTPVKTLPSRALEISTSVLIEHSLDYQTDGFEIPILDGKKILR